MLTHSQIYTAHVGDARAILIREERGRDVKSKKKLKKLLKKLKKRRRKEREMRQLGLNPLTFDARSGNADPDSYFDGSEESSQDGLDELSLSSFAIGDGEADNSSSDSSDAEEDERESNNTDNTSDVVEDEEDDENEDVFEDRDDLDENDTRDSDIEDSQSVTSCNTTTSSSVFPSPLGQNAPQGKESFNPLCMSQASATQRPSSIQEYLEGNCSDQFSRERKMSDFTFFETDEIVDDESANASSHMRKSPFSIRPRRGPSKLTSSSLSTTSATSPFTSSSSRTSLSPLTASSSISTIHTNPSAHPLTFRHSRAIHTFRAFALTHDHNLVSFSEIGRIARKEGNYVAPNMRFLNVLAVARAFGDFAVGRGICGEAEANSIGWTHRWTNVVRPEEKEKNYGSSKGNNGACQKECGKEKEKEREREYKSDAREDDEQRSISSLVSTVSANTQLTTHSTITSNSISSSHAHSHSHSLSTDNYKSQPERVVLRKRQQRDKYIVLGCDGLYDVLTNDDVAKLVMESCASSAPLPGGYPASSLSPNISSPSIASCSSFPVDGDIHSPENEYFHTNIEDTASLPSLSSSRAKQSNIASLKAQAQNSSTSVLEQEGTFFFHPHEQQRETREQRNENWGASASAIASKLKSVALSMGSQDNVTVLVLRLS